jgi:hypothetical protein
VGVVRADAPGEQRRTGMLFADAKQGLTDLKAAVRRFAG